ncbi:sce7725 family protein [Microbulbifer elongatus]|uniref:sce7725 family protein n=1 Tax=Microbulbifer elongatus TaxID=86173 RepID=UPI001E540B02|nr:sce7725 family protein [Microbulbifer elongatus]
MRNSDYKDESPFSYLHVTYSESPKVVGFGDYTILPKDFSEGGGPAYVVTIHASYINADRFDEMYVRHYSSYDDRSPTDPGGKFLDALGKLVNEMNAEPRMFSATDGMAEFEALHEKKHFPGLGHVKKISIKHHVETICGYLKESEGG